MSIVDGVILLRGRIKNYKSEKGFGFILLEDGQDCFFHISDIKFIELPERGQLIECDVINNEKGLVAKNIKLIHRNNQLFVQFGNLRIKTNNIKSYGISSKTFYFEQIFEEYYRKTATTSIGIFFENLVGGVADVKPSEYGFEEIDYERYLDIKSGREIKRRVYAKKGDQIHFKHYSTLNYRDETIYTVPADGIYTVDFYTVPEDVVAETYSYLYVTTYQGDNYQFYENEVDFDIYNKCKELDELL